MELTVEYHDSGFVVVFFRLMVVVYLDQIKTGSQLSFVREKQSVILCAYRGVINFVSAN